MTNKCRTVLFMALLTYCTAGSALSADDLPKRLATACRQAAQNVTDSVIQIETVGGKEIVGDRIIGSAPTTGLVVSEDGFIVSSAFNFVNEPKAILVTLAGGKRLPASIVSRDRSRMLVLLKVEAPEPLPVPDWLERKDTRRGQWAIAMGRTYRSELPSVSLGIISATNRIWGRAIQTDAKVSPVNYGGPLTDLSGRVIGILVPLSPEKRTESAGAELYDAGVGFAIPMEDILRLLPKLQAGEDVQPGLLGVSLAGRDVYEPGNPVIAGCPARSPAAEAGLKKGDQIVAINDVPINSQSQMKHVLGPLNAGELAQVRIRRQQDELDFSVTLVAKVPPYLCPFLGVLPDTPLKEQEGVTVRHVYADSPAEEAGIQVGDVLVQLDDESPQDIVSWREQIAYFEPQNTVRIGIRRNGELTTNEVRLGTYATFQPDPLPRPVSRPSEALDEQQETGLLEIKLAEEPNNCWILVPENYDPRRPHAILVDFPVPGEWNKEAFIEKWQAIANRHPILVVAPLPTDDKRWKKSEVAVTRKLLTRIQNSFNTDPLRIVAFGSRSGGAMAISFAFSERDLVRGLAVVDAAIPRGLGIMENDPLDRLELFFLGMKESPRFARMELLNRTLKKRNFPTFSQAIEGPSGEMNESQKETLADWIDALSRF